MTAFRFSLRSVLAALLPAMSVPGALAQTDADLGRPIVELIDELRKQDLSIVYSDSLLPARLRVTVVPQAADALERLREILAPHGLGIEIGPRDTWLIVRDEAASAASVGGLPLPPGSVPPSLETIVVTASRYSIDREAATSTNEITRHTLENSTAMGQDPLRATHALPGVTGNQLSSQAHFRGGADDEVLLRLDGVRIESPYHLKDFQTIFSSINPRTIESMDVRTGGYEARFGDALSGVVDMRSLTPTGHRHFELGASLLETSVLSSGVFANGRGSWLTSLRRGNLDVLASELDSDIGQPQYVDFFNKLGYDLTARSSLSAGILSLDDKIVLHDPGIATATADYDENHYWLSLSRSGDGGLETDFTVSSAKLIGTRNGDIDDPTRAVGTLADTSTLDRSSLAGDFSISLTDRLHVSYGFSVDSTSLESQVAANRSFVLDIRSDDLGSRNEPPAFARVEHDRTSRAAYMSYRLRMARRLTLELGIRHDEQSLTGESQTSPRLNLLIDIGRRTSLRAAWGEYDQAHALDSLAIADGELELRPAERSEQGVLGVEHRFGDSALVRFEAYTKNVSRLNPRYENLFERVTLLPELLPDRFEIDPVDATIRGIEFSFEGAAGAWRWWGNLARARATDRLPTGSFERGWDERWSVKLGGERVVVRWTVTAIALLRSGWPITGLALADGELVAGSYNALRLPDFASLDARASRRIATAHGALSWFIEIQNLFDRENYCCLDYSYLPASGMTPAGLTLERDAILGIVPNVGLRWEFGGPE